MELAQDLSALAGELANHGFRLCYENWCWATQAPTWRDVYDLMELASRPNIGLCLDTFQTAGYEWGDPTTLSGRRELPSDDRTSSVDEEYHRSLLQLSNTVKPEQIYILQVSDAYKPPTPLEPQADESGQRPRARWSSRYRPMPGTEGGYLPIVDVGSAVLKTGFSGWFSLEIFDGGPDGSGLDASDLKVWAERAHASLADFVFQCEQAM